MFQLDWSHEAVIDWIRQMASRCLGFPWFMQDRELSCSITRNDAWSLHTPSVSVFRCFIFLYRFMSAILSLFILFKYQTKSHFSRLTWGNYCGWLRKLHHVRWLKAYKQWDVYHRFQLVIRISLAHPPYHQKKTKNMRVSWNRSIPKSSNFIGWLVVSNMNFIFHNIWDNPSHWSIDPYFSEG